MDTGEEGLSWRSGAGVAIFHEFFIADLSAAPRRAGRLGTAWRAADLIGGHCHRGTPQALLEFPAARRSEAAQPASAPPGPTLALPQPC